MTPLRMDHVGVVVHDLQAAIEFFVELGMEVEGQMPVEGDWVDRIAGLEGVRVQMAMMRTPDGSAKIELTSFDSPSAIESEPEPPNALGLRNVMFEVANIDDMVTRLKTRGAELVGEIVRYEDVYRLCYLRGPAGIIVALAERIG